MIKDLIILYLAVWGACVSYLLWKVSFQEDTQLMAVVAAIFWPLWPIVGGIGAAHRKIKSYIEIARR